MPTGNITEISWKHVHKHDGELAGKKQDKRGRWRTAKVPSYSTNPIHAYAIDERMKQFSAFDTIAPDLIGFLER